MHKSKMHRLYDINGWAFVATAVGLIALMTLYPIGKSLWLSLHSGRGVILEFAGVSNVIRLFYDPMFKKALWNTLTFLAIQVPIMIFLFSSGLIVSELIQIKIQTVVPIGYFLALCNFFGGLLNTV